MFALLWLSLLIKPSLFFRGETPVASCPVSLVIDQNFLGLSFKLLLTAVFMHVLWADRIWYCTSCWNRLYLSWSLLSPVCLDFLCALCFHRVSLLMLPHNQRVGVSSKGELTRNSFFDSLVAVLLECIPHRLNRIKLWSESPLQKLAKSSCIPWISALFHRQILRIGGLLQEDDVVITVPYGRHGFP